MRYVPPIPGCRAKLPTAAITMGAAVARRARLGAADAAACNPACSLDAVTVFHGRDFTSGRFEMRGSSRSVQANDSSRKEGLWISGGSIFVPRGFVVLLVADVNFFQRDRQPQRMLTGPVALGALPFTVRIIAVQDARTPAEKNRAAQFDALAAEADLSEMERLQAETLRRELETTTRELEQARLLQVRREEERSAIIEAQTRVAAEQAAQAASEQAAAKARGEYQGQLLAQQEFMRQQPAPAPRGLMSKPVMIAAVAAALLVAVVAAMKKRR